MKKEVFDQMLNSGEFENMFKENKINNLLNDGSLSKEQIDKLIDIGKRISKEEIIRRQRDLAKQPGYKEHVLTPLIKKIIAQQGRARDPKTGKYIKQEAIKEQKDEKQPEEQPKEQPEESKLDTTKTKINVEKISKKFQPKRMKNMFSGYSKRTEKQPSSNINTELYTNIAPRANPKLRKGDSAANIATKIFAVMKQDIDDKQFAKEINKNLGNKSLDNEVRRHKELMEALSKAKAPQTRAPVRDPKTGKFVKVEPVKTGEAPATTKPTTSTKQAEPPAKQAEVPKKAEPTKPSGISEAEKKAAQEAEKKAAEKKAETPAAPKPTATKPPAEPEPAPTTTPVKPPTASTTAPPTATPSSKLPPAMIGITTAALAERALAKTKKHEEVRTTAYPDPKYDANRKIKEDYYSIGYGHQITREEIKQGFIKIGNEKVPVISGDKKLGEKTVLTKEQAEVLVRQDFEKYFTAAKKITNFDKLSPEAQMALIDMTYNMGVGWFSPTLWPGLHKALTDLDMDAASKSILNSKYRKDTGKRAEENAEIIRKSKPLVSDSKSNNNSDTKAELIDSIDSEKRPNPTSRGELAQKYARERLHKDPIIIIDGKTTIVNKNSNNSDTLVFPTNPDKPAHAPF